jgi:hypothetical protein
VTEWFSSIFILVANHFIASDFRYCQRYLVFVSDFTSLPATSIFRQLLPCSPATFHVCQQHVF